MLPQKIKKCTSKCKFLIMKGINESYVPFFNDYTSIGVNLDKSKAMRYYNLDEIGLRPSCI